MGPGLSYGASSGAGIAIHIAFNSRAVSLGAELFAQHACLDSLDHRMGPRPPRSQMTLQASHSCSPSGKQASLVKG
eukprot:732885-Pelagomonas_calceolata.AAC.5